ncbi:MAG: hypothetical protein ABWY93_24425 [Mycobacterium sp.]
MTLPPDQPPPGEDPPEDYPQNYPPPGYPPQNYPPPGYPGSAYPYPMPAPPKTSRIAVGMVFVGAPVYVLLNVVVGFMAFVLAGSVTNQNGNWVIGIAALGLALITFVAGGGLLATSNRNAKGFGLGLIIGWALTTIFTVGICTGLNPEVYSR